MAPDSPRSSKRTWLIFVAIVGAVTAGFVTCVALSLRPKGERVGELDLQAPAPLTLDVSSGEAFALRLDVTVGTNGYPPSSRARRDAIYDRLRGSQITITDTVAGSPARSTTCSGYDGKSTSSSDSSNEVAVSGIPITCAFTALAPGRHVLEAKVAWATSTEVHTATLEVRREPPPR